MLENFFMEGKVEEKNKRKAYTKKIKKLHDQIIKIHKKEIITINNQ